MTFSRPRAVGVRQVLGRRQVSNEGKPSSLQIASAPFPVPRTPQAPPPEPPPFLTTPGLTSFPLTQCPPPRFTSPRPSTSLAMTQRTVWPAYTSFHLSTRTVPKASTLRRQRLPTGLSVRPRPAQNDIPRLLTALSSSLRADDSESCTVVRSSSSSYHSSPATTLGSHAACIPPRSRARTLSCRLRVPPLATHALLNTLAARTTSALVPSRALVALRRSTSLSAFAPAPRPTAFEHHHLSRAMGGDAPLPAASSTKAHVAPWFALHTVALPRSPPTQTKDGTPLLLLPTTLWLATHCGTSRCAPRSHTDAVPPFAMHAHRLPCTTGASLATPPSSSSRLAAPPPRTQRLLLSPPRRRKTPPCVHAPGARDPDPSPPAHTEDTTETWVRSARPRDTVTGHPSPRSHTHSEHPLRAQRFPPNAPRICRTFCAPPPRTNTAHRTSHPRDVRRRYPPACGAHRPLSTNPAPPHRTRTRSPAPPAPPRCTTASRASPRRFCTTSALVPVPRRRKTNVTLPTYHRLPRLASPLRATSVRIASTPSSRTTVAAAHLRAPSVRPRPRWDACTSPAQPPSPAPCLESPVRPTSVRVKSTPHLSHHCLVAAAHLRAHGRGRKTD
ncbi:hypothetical protein B0H14DRAFT_3589661 [Mycena olivaceomarginata]|nr:hypothetical protein B0H14DRAFT_3589661 [Mycena olivaceomarginata]